LIQYADLILVFTILNGLLLTLFLRIILVR